MEPANWTPPEFPDVDAILQEAKADARAKQYETALAKHVWFHEHALSIDPAFYGVRLSFALSYWLKLAQQYPPALEKLRQVRDTAQCNVMAGINVRDSFHDMESINDRLDEQARTREVFQVLDGDAPASAEEVFDLAKPALVMGQAYALAGKYLAPKRDFFVISERYRKDKELAERPCHLDDLPESRFREDHLEFAESRFKTDSTTVVALLAINGRRKEAEEIAAAFRNEWDDEPFHAALDEALKGIVPNPWP